MIIREYDADLNGSLNFTEFCQLILPATNDYMRKLALYRQEYDSKYRTQSNNSFKIINTICLLLENEIRFMKRREEIKKELLKREDFIKNKIF